jgi:hypothetical protein
MSNRMRFEIVVVENRLGRQYSEQVVALTDDLRNARAIREALRERYVLSVVINDTWVRAGSKRV